MQDVLQRFPAIGAVLCDLNCYVSPADRARLAEERAQFLILNAAFVIVVTPAKIEIDECVPAEDVTPHDEHFNARGDLPRVLLEVNVVVIGCDRNRSDSDVEVVQTITCNQESMISTLANLRFSGVFSTRTPTPEHKDPSFAVCFGLWSDQELIKNRIDIGYRSSGTSSLGSRAKNTSALESYDANEQKLRSSTQRPRASRASNKC